MAGSSGCCRSRCVPDFLSMRLPCSVGRTARAGRRGRAISFVTQYDVELVHSIEALIGHQLAAYEMPEAEVLKGITRVYAAKRAAQLALADEGSGRSKGGGGGKRAWKGSAAHPR